MHGRVPFKQFDVAPNLRVTTHGKIARVPCGKALISVHKNAFRSVITHELLMNRALIVQPRHPKDAGDTLIDRIRPHLRRAEAAQGYHHDVRMRHPLKSRSKSSAYLCRRKKILVRIQKDDMISCHMAQRLIACSREIILPWIFIQCRMKFCRQFRHTRSTCRRNDNDLVRRRMNACKRAAQFLYFVLDNIAGRELHRTHPFSHPKLLYAITGFFAKKKNPSPKGEVLVFRK